MVSSACVQWPAVTTVARTPFRVHSTFRILVILEQVNGRDVITTDEERVLDEEIFMKSCENLLHVVRDRNL